MSIRLALLCFFPTATLLAQSPRPVTANPQVVPSQPELRRVLRRSFPPDVIAPPTRPLQVKSTRSNCVYPLLDTGTLSIGPCRNVPNKPHLVPPFRKASPLVKPLILPRQ